MEWKPTECLSQTNNSPTRHFGLLILNQPITDVFTFEQLWKRSLYRVCADGGANRLYDLLGPIHENSRHLDFIPDVICGDLDSLRPDVKFYYGEQNSVSIVHNKSQQTTDFDKCLKLLKKKRDAVTNDRQGTFDLNVIGGLGGRVDQGLSLINHLYKASLNPSLFGGKIFLFSEESISFVLHSETNTILTPLSEGFLAKNVGIIPIGPSAVISTRGLRWDVTDWKTEFGGQMSTSNHIKRDLIAVHTTERVLFTVERAKNWDEQARALRDITNQ
ncbi:MAG: hypothetical protein M1812_003127 [Candelaria pacifica]|nr:MAG: hypothetical protein M1812_003127 [Candelaria pacifica]